MSQILREFIKEALNPCGDSDLDKIFATANMAHSGQTRRSGEPYIEHPIEVATLIRRYYPNSDILCKAALLHDALEDAPALGNVKDADELFSIIADAADSEAEAAKITSLVQALTKGEGADYDDYVLSLSHDPDAIKIKMADMLHNLRSSPSEKQLKKYGHAISIIEDSFGGKPPGVSEEHWNDIKDATGGHLGSKDQGVLESFIKEMLVSEGKKIPGAGIVVIRKCSEEWRVCCLKTPGPYDLPKGQIDPGEGAFDAAIRETMEEAGITNLNFGWGYNSITLAHLTMYIASTDQLGSIAPNPHTGILEHEEIHWLNWEDALRAVKPWLAPAIMWARNRVESTSSI